MSVFHYCTYIAILAILLLCVSSYDPSPMQDFCVGIHDSSATAVHVNGNICKDPATVTPHDFHYSGLVKPENITTSVGSKINQVFVHHMPGLNTLGISMARIDYAHRGLNPPHVHPRATEIIYALEGTLYVGFITSNPIDPRERSKLFATIMHPGDVFVFPKGLIHFQYNVGTTSAVALVSFNSQDPGVVTLGRAVFGSEPFVYPEVMAKAFQADEEFVEHMQSLVWDGNN